MAERVIVAGGGMAGLVAAVRLAELGLEPLVVERGDRAGGSMLLSSGVVWRYAEWETFRAECPTGDPVLQRLVWERLDGAIEWLRGLGAPIVRDETGNQRTRGVRFDPAGLTATLAGRLGAALRLTSELPSDPQAPLIVATGGFGASRELVDRYIAPAAPLRLRGNRWSTGAGLEHGLARGAALSAGMDEFYGRNMPAAAWGESDFVPLAQLYAAEARIFDVNGDEFFEAADVSWAETNVVQATAKRPDATAYYLLTAEALEHRVRERTVREIVDAASPEAHVPLGDLPFAPPDDVVVAVRVIAAITHTNGGLRIDDRARVLRPDRAPIPGLYAAGVDAGGISTGGYSSGLAQALVLGFLAAESVAAD